MEVVVSQQFRADNIMVPFLRLHPHRRWKVLHGKANHELECDRMRLVSIMIGVSIALLPLRTCHVYNAKWFEDLPKLVLHFMWAVHLLR
jgi:hypothetical protein